MVKSKNDIAFEILVLLIITLVGLACLIPILFVISYSLTPMEESRRAALLAEMKRLGVLA